MPVIMSVADKKLVRTAFTACMLVLFRLAHLEHTMYSTVINIKAVKVSQMTALVNIPKGQTLIASLFGL